VPEIHASVRLGIRMPPRGNVMSGGIKESA
jgi:hypothetical protein